LDVYFCHSREGGNLENVFMDSRLRGNDKKEEEWQERKKGAKKGVKKKVIATTKISRNSKKQSLKKTN